MSDQDPYEPTRAYPARDPAYDRTEVRRPAPAQDRTQRLPADGGSAEAPPRREEPISYTEDYASDGYAGAPGRDRTVVDRGGPPVEDEQGRSFSTTALVLTSIAALLVGAILTLLLLPEEDPQVVLSEQAAQQALTEAQQVNAEQAARISELEAQVAERDAQIAQLQAQQSNDQAAADQAAAERQAALDAQQAALDQRQADLDAREQAVAQREADVAAREQAVAEGEAAGPSGGFELPDVPDLEVPAELPQIDEEAARGVIERFVDRLGSIFGS